MRFRFLVPEPSGGPGVPQNGPVSAGGHAARCGRCHSQSMDKERSGQCDLTGEEDVSASLCFLVVVNVSGSAVYCSGFGQIEQSPRHPECWSFVKQVECTSEFAVTSSQPDVTVTTSFLLLVVRHLLLLAWHLLLLASC